MIVWIRSGWIENEIEVYDEKCNNDNDCHCLLSIISDFYFGVFSLLFSFCLPITFSKVASHINNWSTLHWKNECQRTKQKYSTILNLKLMRGKLEEANDDTQQMWLDRTHFLNNFFFSNRRQRMKQLNIHSFLFISSAKNSQRRSWEQLKRFAYLKRKN